MYQEILTVSNGRIMCCPVVKKEVASTAHYCTISLLLVDETKMKAVADYSRYLNPKNRKTKINSELFQFKNLEITSFDEQLRAGVFQWGFKFYDVERKFLSRSVCGTLFRFEFSDKLKVNISQNGQLEQLPIIQHCDAEMCCIGLFRIDQHDQFQDFSYYLDPTSRLGTKYSDGMFRFRNLNVNPVMFSDPYAFSGTFCWVMKFFYRAEDLYISSPPFNFFVK
jgi:hypothetical protein